MYLVWITNLSMNIIQTSQIKSNKMMVEKLLEKSKEKKIWRKTNIMFLSNVFWHFVLLFHSRKPAQYNNDFRILSFRSFYLLCSIRWPLSVINWMLSIKNELPFYNSLFFLSIGSQCNSENHGTTDLQMKTTKIYGSFQFDHWTSRQESRKRWPTKRFHVHCIRSTFWHCSSISYYSFFFFRQKKEKERNPFLCVVNFFSVMVRSVYFYSGGIGVNSLQLHSSHKSWLFAI